MAKRNARKAAPATAVKGTGRARRASISSTSTFDLSSNDNYSGVDDISDDEDDDEDDVFAVEEQAIMGESSPSPPSTPRPHDHNNWAHAGANDDDSDSSNNDANDDESDGSVAGHEASDEDDASWQGIQSDNPELNAELNPDELFNFDDHVATQRRVRFNVPTDDSSDESTEDDHAGMFPDIFVDQSTLDPSFRRQIENEYDESSASDSFWDHTALYNDRLDDESDADIGFGDASALHIPLTDDQTPLDSTSLDPDFGDFDNHDLDGYESDGETTEDEEYPHPPTCRRSSRSISDNEDSDSDSEDEKPVRRREDQPHVARYKLEPKKKPMAVYNTKTGKMIILTPDPQRRLDLSPEQFRMDPFDGFSWPMENQMSPVGGNLDLMFNPFPSNLMMTSGNDGLDDIFGNSTGVDHSSPSMEGESSLESDRDPENGLKVSDFIDLDNASSSDEEDGAPKANDPSTTPVRPTTASSDGDVLSHLNPATVGAFRRNQVNSQLMIRNQATQDSLDFSGPFNSTAIRGIRSDRFDTAAVPLTPVRRHKKQLSDARSPLDPVSAKRKAPSDATPVIAGHKKQKSISDVGALRL